jgi:hypothetical protein
LKLLRIGLRDSSGTSKGQDLALRVRACVLKFEDLFRQRQADGLKVHLQPADSSSEIVLRISMRNCKRSELR